MKGRGLNLLAASVALLILAAASPVAIRGDERDDYRCGRHFECARCGGRRCCSTSEYCGDTDAYCKHPNCQLQCKDSTPGCFRAPPAAYNMYSTDGINGATAPCSTATANISMDGVIHGGARQPNNVTSYRAACGHCLKVNTRVTQRKDGKQMKVRLPVDDEECSNSQLSELGKRIFQELDTDGEGRAVNRGYLLVVDYQVVQCDDEH
ncbi:unnamed protein product [Linum tenue]|uniref:Chitin-binding type-1 domain-containing protein n=1 Tax=Linum tenue TaxID=586396 RepID=A0AAV0N7M4_9ROSI|nr:unnamed protein product [Linum tenue]